MSLDLFFGNTKRNWSRTRELTNLPALPSLVPTPNIVDESRQAAIATARVVHPRGKGAVVTTTWKW
jgi:hypothetical protein